MDFLLIDDRFYAHIGSEGWFTSTADAVTSDWEGVYESLEERLPFDYRDLVANLGAELVDLSIEEIDGMSYLHVQATSSIAGLVESGASNPTGVVEEPVRDEGDTMIDFWFDPETGRLYKLAFDYETVLVFGGKITTELDYVFDYGVTVSIPEPRRTLLRCPSSLARFTERTAGTPHSPIA